MAAETDPITAILLSWRRPQNLPRLLDQLRASPLVSEILLWNNNPEITLDFPGVTVINSPRNYRCVARYCLVPLARHETIWFQDDDVVIRPEQLAQIHAAYRREPTRIYGAAGRDLVEGLYSADLVHGECDIVLGQTMLFHRSLLHHAFEPLGRVSQETVDDIVFSLACGRRHFAVDVGPLEMPGWNDEAALWRQPGHFDDRQRAVHFMRAWK